MAGRTSFIVQAFQERRGRLIRTSPVLATSRADAMARAKALAARAAGAAAISVVTAEASGEQIAATVLSQHGRLPDGFADEVRRRV